jgi:hypothetical protein
MNVDRYNDLVANEIIVCLCDALLERMPDETPSV